MDFKPCIFFLGLTKTFIKSPIHWNLNINAGTRGANNYWFERNLAGVVAVIVAVHHLLLVVMASQASIAGCGRSIEI